MNTASLLFRIRPALRLPSMLCPSAARTVGLAFTILALILFAFIFRHASPIPVHDELCMIPFLFDEPGLGAYWSQHNEHRIPLPRLLYAAAYRVAGNDFRAPQFLNALLLAAAAGIVLAALRRARGQWAYSDALVPLALLTIGQYGNLLWGFQIQFIASTCLVLLATALATAPGLMTSKKRLVGLAVCGTLLPLCGANGVAFAPGIGLVLLFAGVWNVWGKAQDWAAASLAVLGGLAPIAVVGAYYWGLQSSPHHAAGTGELRAILIGAVNLFGAAFGPVARQLPPRPYEGITLCGFLGLALVTATGWRLIVALRNPIQRPQAIAFTGILAGFLGLAAGISKARSGFGNVLDVNRYYTLMLPMLVGAYIVWSAFGARWFPRILFALAVATAVPNFMIGVREGPHMFWWVRAIECEIEEGVPLDFIADRHCGLFPHEPEVRRVALSYLRSRNVQPFNRSALLPPLRQEFIPLSIVKRENFEIRGDSLRVTQGAGHVVYALPRQQIYGIKLQYDAMSGSNAAMPNVLSWELAGQIPKSDTRGVVDQLEPRDHPSETWVYLNCEADTLRIDLWGEDARVRIHSIHILTRIE